VQSMAWDQHNERLAVLCQGKCTLFTVRQCNNFVKSFYIRIVIGIHML